MPQNLQQRHALVFLLGPLLVTKLRVQRSWAQGPLSRADSNCTQNHPIALNTRAQPLCQPFFMSSSFLRVCKVRLFKYQPLLTHAITWMNHEDIMLNEIRHKRINIVWFHLYEVPRIVKFIEKENKIIARRCGKERTRSCCLGTKFQFGMMKTFWRWMMIMVTQQYECS